MDCVKSTNLGVGEESEQIWPMADTERDQRGGWRWQTTQESLEEAEFTVTSGQKQGSQCRRAVQANPVCVRYLDWPGSVG